MWNEAANDEDSIQLLSVASRIGHADVSSATIDPQSKPGYPAYFVVLPDREIILNLKFEHRLNGSQSFKRYILGFLRDCTRFCIWDEGNPDKLLGYSPTQEIEENTSYLPEFEYHLLRRQGNIEWLQAQSSNIRKVRRRAVVNPTISNHKTFLDSSFELMGLPVNNRLKAEIRFEYEFKTHLTLEKLNKVIDACSVEGDDSAWEDVGFVMAKASGKTHWVSGSYAREKTRLEPPRTQGGMIDTEALARLLSNGQLERLLAVALSS